MLHRVLWINVLTLVPCIACIQTLVNQHQVGMDSFEFAILSKLLVFIDVFFSVSKIGILGERKPEFSQQESNHSTTVLQETHGS